MTKWQCTKCDPYDPCFYESGKTCTEPTRCPLVEGNKPYWQPIRSEDWGKQQIPDWIKVGAWVYNKGEDIYGVVMSIDLPDIEVKYDGRDIVVNTISTIVQARIRPYNRVEMRTLVGKVIDFEENSDLVISYDGENGEVYVDDVWLSGEELLNNEYMYLGKPCGIPVHLNEKGEWVE